MTIPCQTVDIYEYQDFLANRGFEEVDLVDSTKPRYWKTYKTGSNHQFLYPETGRVGGKSVAVKYATREVEKRAAWVQNVLIDTTKTYRLAGYIKTDNIIPGVVGQDGATIYADWKSSTFAYLSGSGIMIPKSGTSEWALYERDVIPNINAKYATIVLALSDSSGVGIFDDISFDINLVPNSGLENGFDIPTNWSKYQTGIKAVFKYPDTGRTGRGVSIYYPSAETGKLALWGSNYFSISSTKRYKCSAYMKTENVIGVGARTLVEWYNVSNIRTGWNFIVSKTGSSGWTKYESTFTPPTGSAKMRIRGDINASSGKAYWDDFAVIEV